MPPRMVGWKLTLLAGLYLMVSGLTVELQSAPASASAAAPTHLTAPAPGHAPVMRAASPPAEPSVSAEEPAAPSTTGGLRVLEPVAGLLHKP